MAPKEGGTIGDHRALEKRAYASNFHLTTPAFIRSLVSAIRCYGTQKVITFLFASFLIGGPPLLVLIFSSSAPRFHDTHTVHDPKERGYRIRI